MSHDFENPTHRIPGFQNLVDFLFHPLLGLRIGATEQDLFPDGERPDLLPGNFFITNRCRPDRNHVTQHLNAELVQEQFRHSTNGNPCRRLTG